MKDIDKYNQKHKNIEKENANHFFKGTIIISLLSLLSLFSSIVMIQYYYIIPEWMSWINYIATFFNACICLCSFWIFKRNISTILLVTIFIVQIFLVGINLFFNTNGMYIVHAYYGLIHEQLNFFKVSISICIIVIIIYFIEFWILASPKLLLRRIKDLKTLSGAIACGLITILGTIYGLLFLRDHVLYIPREVSGDFDGIITAAILMGGTFALLAVTCRMLRSKSSRSA